MARAFSANNTDYLSGGPVYTPSATCSILWRSKTGSTDEQIVFGRRGATGAGFLVGQNGSSSSYSLRLLYFGIADYVSSNNACVHDNAWHAYAIIISGGTATFYRDGTAFGSTGIGACVADSQGVGLGLWVDNKDPKLGGLNGALAEVAFFSRALDATDRGRWFDGDSPALYNTNLDHYWKLDETSGGASATTGGYNLTQVGTVGSTTHPTMYYTEGSVALIASTSESATFSGGAKVNPMTSFTVTAEDATFSGAASIGAASAVFALTTGESVFSGGATGDTTQGTITTPVLKNNTGTVLANQTGITAYVYTPATGALVVKLTGQTTNGSGVMTFTDTSIVAGTQYRVVIVLGSGAEGMDKLTAS